jgi:drug/metabolite transporter (DMT)-like permease
MKRYMYALPWMVLSGFFFGLHFSSWVYSIQHTSLIHSMLWVSMGPIIINSGHWMLYFLSSSIPNCCIGIGLIIPNFSANTVSQPSRMETAGAAIGLLGAGLMLIDVQQLSSSSAITNTKENANAFEKSHDPTLHGDIAAFVGAVAVSLYFVIGQQLRKWVPVWMYSFPVVGCGALTCAFFNWVSLGEAMSFGVHGPTALFGFAGKQYWLMSLYLGIGPGVCGHTLVTGLLKYISPLTVSTAMLLEPLIGSVLGYYLGMQPIPGGWTWFGGVVLMLGLFLVVFSVQPQPNVQVEEEAACSTDREEESAEVHRRE